MQTNLAVLGVGSPLTQSPFKAINTIPANALVRYTFTARDNAAKFSASRVGFGISSKNFFLVTFKSWHMGERTVPTVGSRALCMHTPPSASLSRSLCVRPHAIIT